jgi:hypothetical protein
MLIQKYIGVLVLLQFHPAGPQGPGRVHQEADGQLPSGADGSELQVILPRKSKQVLYRTVRVHRQSPAPAAQLGPEPKSVLYWVWRLRRALAVLQQPARGRKVTEVARLQTHEEVYEDLVGKLQQKPLLRMAQRLRHRSGDNYADAGWWGGGCCDGVLAGWSTSNIELIENAGVCAGFGGYEYYFREPPHSTTPNLELKECLDAWSVLTDERASKGATTTTTAT